MRAPTGFTLDPAVIMPVKSKNSGVLHNGKSGVRKDSQQSDSSEGSALSLSSCLASLRLEGSLRGQGQRGTPAVQSATDTNSAAKPLLSRINEVRLSYRAVDLKLHAFSCVSVSQR